MQFGRYTLTLFVQVLGGETFAGFDHAVLVHRNGTNGIVGYIHLVTANAIRLMGCDDIRQIDLAVFDMLDGVHLGIEIAHVIHLLA